MRADVPNNDSELIRSTCTESTDDERFLKERFIEPRVNYECFIACHCAENQQFRLHKIEYLHASLLFRIPFVRYCIDNTKPLFADTYARFCQFKFSCSAAKYAHVHANRPEYTKCELYFGTCSVLVTISKARAICNLHFSKK